MILHEVQQKVQEEELHSAHPLEQAHAFFLDSAVPLP